MKFSLIICTYMRCEALSKLLMSIQNQIVYPNEILIVDGSINDETKQFLEKNFFENLKYYKVEEAQRGLTKQRNYGINLISSESEIVCFLDDDVILEKEYFKNLINTYKDKKDALAVGGYITNEVVWEKSDEKGQKNKYYYDGWMRNESSRFKIRSLLGLQPDAKPGFLPTFAHGRSIGYLPPSNKIYNVEFFMGGVSSYKKLLFDKIKFSNYFHGYGLYEDLDFCLRASKLGKLYLNTAAKLEHHHEESGRPNKFIFGKMIVRNSWYVWKVKYKNPTFKAVFKYHSTVLLLILIRFANSFYGNNKKQAFTETLGRLKGWFSLFYNKPKLS
ncbi:glycosyltransferase family 2 protein [Flavivirga rizhaonensis]|uniref:Glycosyltransferase family 2 protein n=1 Tax=Flavivirga rizhaonensis TaxID=2559571 RepID=A0A4V3P594_9FLAO|nr:glycosyltransferase [Flavivirga rizhaonensis]TGV04434.1 glycosyltransferase family 2 protein [Flavivirga rizhaonensis]